MNKARILIVEDEPSIVDNIKYVLESDGFDTVWHNAGSEVLPLLSMEQIDLIVLDIGLPDINGLELCKAIRKDYSIPIIFLTARSGEIDKVVGLEIGADDYIAKPFSPRELSARIKAVLRRTRNLNNFPNPESSCKNPSVFFHVDESRHSILYFETSLDLSRYEYEILKTFINRPGQVFSRDRLMDLVWDEPESSLDRTVDTHIKNIRSKLKIVRPDLDPIITHRGVGYSLKENL